MTTPTEWCSPCFHAGVAFTCGLCGHRLRAGGRPGIYPHACTGALDCPTAITWNTTVRQWTCRDPKPGPGHWDWRCLTCNQPVTAHPRRFMDRTLSCLVRAHRSCDGWGRARTPIEPLRRCSCRCHP